ncbi:MAG: YkgJ family cysteine cluster protein [Vampirovibrionales bacterium]|nr:YkgJ family cysteine cluster protein [Vampirovibrionales bacterium]
MPSASELTRLRARYRDIFETVRQQLEARLLQERAAFSCQDCGPVADMDAALSQAHPGCGYRPWLKLLPQALQSDIGQDVWRRLQEIEAYKKTFSCHMCGVCCRFASSEFSFEELLGKARQGDGFARQFTSIFLPYESTQAARERFPAMVEDVLSHVAPKEAVYFYHCPYVGEDNRCTIYGRPQRPGICDTYPDTPLTFIYERCAWKPWQDAVGNDALLAHATIELCAYWLARIERILEETAS